MSRVAILLTMARLRIAAPPADPAAVFNYRTRWPAMNLADQGEIDLVLAEEPQVRMAVRRHGPDEPVGITNLPDVDVIVLTRILAGSLVTAIPLIQREGIAVVVDIDDEFRHLPLRMLNREKIQPAANPHYNWRHAAKACAAADLVTCSTSALCAWAPHGRVQVVRNCVPARYCNVDTRRDGRTVGWSGAASSRPGDLESTRGGVAQALERMNGEFMVVGERAGVRRALGLTHEPHCTGLVEHERYPYKIAEFDLGIAPLVDNAFNRAKSALKPIQYMATGVPWVGSPSYEYQRLYEHMAASDCAAVGALAKPRSRDWCREVLRALTRSEDERQALSRRARDYVLTHHTIERNCWKWAESWERAVHHRRGKP